MKPAVRAAVEIARKAGLVVGEPAILQETNNTVIWLRPAPVVAKVATRPDAMAGVRLEHAVAVELAGLGAEIVAPVLNTAPVTHQATGFVVTLWERFDGFSGAEIPAVALADSLHWLHASLAQGAVVLPSFRISLSRARGALDDDDLMAALAPVERAFVRDLYDEGLAHLDEYSWEEQRLHGEPHGGNRLIGRTGLRWIDFESCCVGPWSGTSRSSRPRSVVTSLVFDLSSWRSYGASTALGSQHGAGLGPGSRRCVVTASSTWGSATPAHYTFHDLALGSAPAVRRSANKRSGLLEYPLLGGGDRPGAVIGSVGPSRRRLRSAHRAGDASR